MSTWSTLEIGKRALQASNFALDVTATNIANIETYGYSRRQVTTSESFPFLKYGQRFGTGVTIDSLRSFRQQYYDREIRKSNSTLSGLEAEVLFYNNMEVIFQEPSDNNLGEILNRFLYYFDELALQPESLGLRQNLLSISQVLIERLNNASNDLYELRRQANTDLINQVTQANEYIQTIAECNKAIAISKDPSGHDCLTFIDHREVAIEKLSQLCNVTVSYEPNGIANVFVNGIDVVTGPSVQVLKVLETNNDLTGESTLSVVTYDSRKDLTVEVNPPSGKMGAALKQYNILLDPVESSGAFSIMQTLDSFANGIALAVNGLLSGGYGLNDLDDVPPGRVLFESSSGDPITAGNIKISDSVLNVSDIPLSSSPNSPGNSTIAQDISRILQDQKFIDDQTPMEFYSNFIGRISQQASEVVAGRNAARLVNESLNTTRDSIMGVNMEEEAINIVKYQKYLEAASKIVETNNTVLGIIINLGR